MPHHTVPLLLVTTISSFAVTGPQLISMSPEELSEQLGATPLQAHKIHSELNGLGSSSDLLGSNTTTAAPPAPAPPTFMQAPPPLTPAQEAAAYNTAGTTGAFIDPRNPYSSNPYNSNQDLSGFQIGGAAAAGAATGAALGAAAMYSPMGTTAAVAPPRPGLNAYPLPASPTGGGSSSGGLANQSQGSGDFYTNTGQIEQQQTSKDSYLSVCRSFFAWWMVLLLPLLLVAMGDLGLTIYMNGKFSENNKATTTAAAAAEENASTSSEWGPSKSEGVYSTHYINAEMFWCILFYVAQGYTIVISIILIAFLSTIGRSGTLSGTKNLAFATLLLSFLGLTLYTLPIVKWTYVIVTDYSLSEAFSGNVIPAVAFGLEWFAVLLWLICMILAAVQLGLLSRKRYKS
jgi:hypothetical protein